MKNITLLTVLLFFAVGFSQENTGYTSNEIRSNRIDNPAVFSTEKGAKLAVSPIQHGSFDFNEPRTLAEMPNVINNPSVIEFEGKDAQSSSNFHRTNSSCSEENPNDFTFENGYPCSHRSPYKTANDLTVAADENFTLTGITASIFANGGIANVAVTYYSNASGRPGTIIGSEASVTINSQTIIGNNYGLDVNEVELSVTPFEFAGQSGNSTKYWVQLVVTDTGATNNVYWLITSSSTVGSYTEQFDGQWTAPDPVDGVYIWHGDCETIGEGSGDDFCSENNPNDFFFENGFRCSSATPHKVANDLTVGVNENFTLNNITASVFANNGITNVAVNYYDDAGGIPGSLIGSEASAIIDTQTVIGNNFGYDVNELELTVTPFLFAGQTTAQTKYWIELSVTDGGSTSDVYWIVTSTSSVGNPTALYDNEWLFSESIYDGVYSWKGICETIDENVEPFPNPYCGPLTFRSNVEPISLVSVAGIYNVSNPELDGSPAHEDFTGINGIMLPGNTYPISLEGNTAGAFENRFAVFIDWNQNNILDDEGEVYEITETLTGSTGIDGQQATGLIDVPVDAIVGITRMRVKKISGNANYLNPCLGASYGQAEDYSIQITATNVDYVFENNVWTPEDPSGVCTSVDNIHVINGIAVFNTDIVANNIIIDLGATLNISEVLTISGNLTINGNLVFVSTDTGIGELGFFPESSIITGDATVQRFMSNRRSYRMVSSAVTTSTSIHDNWQEGATSNTDNPNPGFGTHITGSTIDQQNGFDATDTGNASMFFVNVANQEFETMDNTNLNTFTAGGSYLLFVRGDRSIDLGNNSASSATILRATGSLYTGTHTQDFPAADSGDFVMFGNPYQSVVDIRSVFAGSSNLNEGHYYVYDPNMADNGAYITVLLPSGSNTSGSAANQYLQPGQAAQVATIGAAPSVVFKETDKTPGEFTSINRPLTGDNMLTGQLFTAENFVNNRLSHDSFGILFAEGNDNEITFADAMKPMNFYENLGIEHEGTYLSLEYRNMPQPAEMYPLYSAGYTHSDYTLKLSVAGLEGISLYLDDDFTGTSTLLEAGDNIYSFSVNVNDALSIATDRFSIRTEQRLNIDDNSSLSGIRLFPNPMDGNKFYIHAPKLNGEQLSVSIRDISGRKIYNQTLECRSNTVTVSMGDSLSSGVYMVTLKHGGEAHTYRLLRE